VKNIRGIKTKQAKFVNLNLELKLNHELYFIINQKI